jgi:hypothetical protein
LTIMVGVKAKALKLSQAAELLAVSYRQSKRIWRRYQAAGAAPAVEAGRDSASARWLPLPRAGARGWFRPRL